MTHTLLPIILRAPEKNRIIEDIKTPGQTGKNYETGFHTRPDTGGIYV